MASRGCPRPPQLTRPRQKPTSGCQECARSVRAAAVAFRRYRLPKRSSAGEQSKSGPGRTRLMRIHPKLQPPCQTVQSAGLTRNCQIGGGRHQLADFLSQTRFHLAIQRGNRCKTTPGARLIKFSLPALPWLRSIQSGLSGFNSSDERLGSAGDSARRSLAWFWRSAGLNASETMRVYARAIGAIWSWEVAL